MERYRFYITVNPSSDTAEAASIEQAGVAAREMWNDAVNLHEEDSRQSLPTSIFIELKMIPDWDNSEPSTEEPWTRDKDPV